MQDTNENQTEIDGDDKLRKSAPTVSMGLTVFNAEKYLKQTIESLLGQSFQDFELIISDNASGDKSSDICREYEKKDSRISYVRNETNLGSIQNMTNVFELSSGKYFMWASDHDLWDPDALTSYIGAFSKDKDAVLVYSPATIIDEVGGVIKVDHTVQSKKDKRIYQTFLDTITGRIGPHAFCGLYKAEALEQVSLTRCFGFDTILLAELSLKGSFVELETSCFHLRQNRPPETLRDQVGRYIKMLFEKDPNEYVKSMPYEHMIYRYLCMIQSNNLNIDEQAILNQYILLTFTKLWGIKQDNIAHIIREIDRNSRLEYSSSQQHNINSKRKFKNQNNILDVKIFSGAIRNTDVSQLADKLTEKTKVGTEKNNIPKKFLTNKQYDVCYVLYNTDKWGGVKSVLSHINGLVDRGYRVCLVSKSGPPTWHTLKSDFVRSTTLLPPDIPESDIIIGTWYPTLLPACQSGRGTVVHYSQGYEGLSSEITNSQRDAIENIYKLPTTKIVNAPHVGNLIKDKFAQNFHVVHNDIDHEVFYPQNNKRNGNRKNILIVGPFEVIAKGIRVCLAACDIIRQEYSLDINIIRVSQTPRTQEEAALCIPFGDRYTFRHNLTEKEMASLYNSCDILLAGSYPAGDSFGLPAMEALSCGLPVVLTDIPAHRDFDDKHDFARFVPAGDSNAMAKAAVEVLTNGEFRDNLVTCGLAVSAQYNIKRTIDELETALKGILDKRPVNKESTGMPAAEYYSFERPEIQQMVNTSSRRILDIGCAAGALGGKLKNDRGAEVWGVEIVPEIAKRASLLLDRVIISGIENSMDQIPDSYFDTIILADVLEHLRHPQDVLASLRNKLTASGEIIASIPNVRHWSVVKDLLEGRWDYVDAGILDRTHLRFFTRNSIINLFQKTGFIVHQMEATKIKGQDMPKEIVSALSKTGLDTSTLEVESTHYQYLVKASLQKRIQNTVSIIILTFNELQYTRQCIASIAKHTPEAHEIIFVDNGSKDGTAKWLRKLVEENSTYRLIENTTNLGFAKGCNQGIEAASGDYILLLNNDVVVADGWLSGLTSCLNHAPDAGIVGPMTNNISGPQQIHDDSYRSVDDLDKYAARVKERFHHRRIPLNRIVGFCMLFKRTLFEQIGGLDESFGTGNFEDDDFCLRVTLAGYNNYVAGDVFIHHFGSRSFIGSKIDYGASISGNRKILENKWRTSISSPQGKRMAVLQVQDMAHVIYSKGKTDQAIEALINCIKLAPDAKEIYYELALILIESERFSEAWEVMESMPETAKNELKGLELAGYAKEGLGLDDEAAFYADKMLTLDGKYPAALNLRGVLAYKKDTKKKAADDFEQAINADPGYGEAYTNLGVLCWGLDKKEEALAHLKRGFVLSPTIPDVSSLYYSVVSSLGMFSDAEADFREACRLYSDNKSLAFLLIDILIQQGKFDSAIVRIEDALSIFGLDDGTLNAALAVREKLGPLQIEKASKKGTLSLCMIVKNEEKHLVKCLKSIRDIVDEIIIVDTGSTDKTKDIATVFGAKLFDFPWTGDFAAARNHSLEQATGNWILVLDADEVISSLDFKRLREIIHRKSASPLAYAIATRNYARSATIIGWTQNKGDYPEEAGPGWFISTKVRLFTKHKNIFFSNPVHELVESSLQKVKIPIASCKIVVHHYGKLDEQKDLQKGEDYYLLGKIKYDNDPTNMKYILELARQAFGLNKCEEAVDLWLKLLSLFLRADSNSPAYKELLDVTYGDPLSEIYNQLAAVYLTLDRYEEALATARKAMECKTKLKESVYTYVHCEIIAGSLDKAFCELDNLLKTMPDYPPAMLLMSVIFCLEGKKDKAQEYFRLLQQDQVYLPPLLNNFARQLRNQGRMDGALLILNMAIESKMSNDETKNLFETLQKSNAGFINYTPQGRLDVPQPG